MIVLGSIKRKAVFLDRDGVINEVIFRGSDKPIAPWTFNEFKLCSDISAPLRKLSISGYMLFVVTNQPDISKGLISEKTVIEMNELILKKFPIQKVVFCPHEDSHNCFCRKPEPGMILELADEHNIELSTSYMIGDNWKDIVSGAASGCSTVLIKKPYNKNVNADFHVDSLREAVNLIISSGESSNELYQ